MAQCHCRRLTGKVRRGLIQTKEIAFPLWALESGVGRLEGGLTFCRFLKLQLQITWAGSGGGIALLTWVFPVQKRIVS